MLCGLSDKFTVLLLLSEDSLREFRNDLTLETNTGFIVFIINDSS